MHTLLVATLVLQVVTSARELTEDRVKEAIELGRAGTVPVVRAGTFLGISKGDFNVFVEGPVARIAAAASEAFKQYRPFDANSVATEMKALVYRVHFQRDLAGGGRPVGAVKHIVLQPRRAKGMDGVVQPLKENIGNREAYFDRFPDGEFDIVIVMETGPQRYNVSAKDRAKIR